MRLAFVLFVFFSASLAAPIPEAQPGRGVGGGNNGAQGATNTAAAAAAPTQKANANTNAAANQAAGGKKGQGNKNAANTNTDGNTNTNTNTNTNANKGGQKANTAASGTTTTAAGAGNGGKTGTTGSTAAANTQAAQDWMTDTGKVSGFLDKAATLKGQAFTSAAAVALAAEKDELTHKAVLDMDAQIKGETTQANNLLVTQGHFQDVVNMLQDMVTKGDSVAVKDTQAINANRCKNVLPSIDAYLKAAGTNLKSVRPIACQ